MALGDIIIALELLYSFKTLFVLYSSMVIRDLTLRSAASFGSFHLIRLLYDEYMFFLIEHQVALETGETPIAVMGEVSAYIVTYFLWFKGKGKVVPVLN
jgi:hypothetical protein